MKLLIADFLFVEAHKDMNINFINSMSRFADVDVVSLNGYYEEQTVLLKDNTSIISVHVNRKTGSFNSRLFSMALMKEEAFIAMKKAYDAIICLGFETMTFGLNIRKFQDVPIFIFHHKNIDELTSKIKRVAFNSYMNKVYHVVFEVFFKDRLREWMKVPSERIFVIPHPVKSIKSSSTIINYNCVGLCNSNDEFFIEDAIRKDDVFKKGGFHIILRSKVLEKSDGAVTVIKGFLKKDIYDEIINSGETVFVPLPENYIYRLSGSIYDALARGKCVYTTSKYYADEYERRYPGTCRYVCSVDQLIDSLKQDKGQEQTQSFQRFLEDHSIDKVSQDIEVMIKEVIHKGNY